MNEIAENRWAQAHDELKSALRLPGAEASARANELVHQALQQTLRTDAEAVQTLTDWNTTLDRLENAAGRRGADDDEREELEEDRLKADSMEEASLTAMHIDAAHIARLVQVATASPKVRLDREVAEEVAQLNFRTVDEDNPDGLVAPVLGLTRDEFARRYAPEGIVHQQSAAIPGTRTTATRGMNAGSRDSAPRADGIDFSREGSSEVPALQVPIPRRRIAATTEHPSPIVITRIERDQERTAASDMSAPRSRRETQPIPRVPVTTSDTKITGPSAEKDAAGDRGPEY